MFKLKEDYEGMIVAAIKGTKSNNLPQILKYIQTHFTVPTNFEKYVRQKWGQMGKRKVDVLCNSPPKSSNKKRSSDIPSRNLLSLDLYLPNEIIHQIFKYLSPQDLLKFREVCTQWKDVAQDKGLRRVVKLSSAIFLPYSFLRAVLRGASVIQEIDLSGSSITDHLASLLAQKPPASLKRLHTLNISKCALLSPTGCFNLLRAFSSATLSLTSLNVAECKIDDSIVNQYISKFKSLTFLDISRIWTISTTAVFNITQNCTKLQRINMVNLTFLFDSAIASLAENCKDLSHVDMSCCYGLTTSTLAHLNSHPLKYLSIRSILVNSEFSLPPTLRQLDMSKCTGITDDYLKPIITSCNRLEVLNLSECPDITDASLELISTHLRSTLIKLSISGCFSFTPEGIETIIPTFTNLTELDIAHLNLSDSLFTDHFASFKGLKHLDVSYNTLITDAGVLAICKTCPKLKEFICNGLQTGSGPASLRKCGVTFLSLAHIRKNCTSIHVVSMLDTLPKDIHSSHIIGFKKACIYLEQLHIGPTK